MQRKIKGLIEAEALDYRPAFLPAPPKRKGMTGAGLGYEDKVARKLKAELGDSRVLHGQWFSYLDENGPGWCQTDVLILPLRRGSPLYLLECKLSYKYSAKSKMEELYLPVVQGVFKPAKVRMVQVCKNVRDVRGEPVVSRLDQLYKQKRNYVVWNWLNP